MVDLMTLPHHTTAHHAPTEPQSPTRQQSVDLQADNWLYEIRQKGQNTACYVMVQNVQDLVKSHLMFAVREEVEVLKEKIAELMDRINQLEVENTILRQNATQETLQQLTANNPTNNPPTNPTNGPIS